MISLTPWHILRFGATPVPGIGSSIRNIFPEPAVPLLLPRLELSHMRSHIALEGSGKAKPERMLIAEGLLRWKVDLYKVIKISDQAFLAALRRANTYD